MVLNFMLEPSSQPRNDAKIPCCPHRSPSVSLLLTSDLAGLVLIVNIIIISAILFPLVPITASLGALVKVCIISMEQHTNVLACMDFSTTIPRHYYKTWKV
jgi:hypothetical protein